MIEFRPGVESFLSRHSLARLGFSCRDKGFLGCDRVGQGKGKVCCDIANLCRNKANLCYDGELSVATELATTESSVTRDKVEHVKASARNRAHDKRDRELCCDREFFVATYLSNSKKKKKKDPRDLRHHRFPKIQHEIQLYFRETPLKVCFQPLVNFPKNLHALNDVGRTSYYLLSPLLSSHLFLFLLSPPYLTTLTPIHPTTKLLSQPNHNPPKSPSSHQQAIFP